MSKWVAHVHRVSGIALALFLPAHFWVLGQGLEMDGFLRWTE
jgi:fumarate reductase subunit D